MFLDNPYQLNLLIEGVIYGHLPSGKNKYRFNGKTKAFYKNDPVSEKYEDDFNAQINVLKNQFKVKEPIEDRDLALFAKIYFQSLRRDCDTILFCDLLQKYKVVKNDRAIRIKILDGINIDPENPRIEFKLYKVEQQNGHAPSPDNFKN